MRDANATQGESTTWLKMAGNHYKMMAGSLSLWMISREFTFFLLINLDDDRIGRQWNDPRGMTSRALTSFCWFNT